MTIFLLVLVTLLVFYSFSNFEFVAGSSPSPSSFDALLATAPKMGQNFRHDLFIRDIFEKDDSYLSIMAPQKVSPKNSNLTKTANTTQPPPPPPPSSIVTLNSTKSSNLTKPANTTQPPPPPPTPKSMATLNSTKNLNGTEQHSRKESTPPPPISTVTTKATISTSKLTNSTQQEGIMSNSILNSNSSSDSISNLKNSTVPPPRVAISPTNSSREKSRPVSSSNSTSNNTPSKSIMSPITTNGTKNLTKFIDTAIAVTAKPSSMTKVSNSTIKNSIPSTTPNWDVGGHGITTDPSFISESDRKLCRKLVMVIAKRLMKILNGCIKVVKELHPEKGELDKYFQCAIKCGMMKLKLVDDKYKFSNLTFNTFVTDFIPPVYHGMVYRMGHPCISEYATIITGEYDDPLCLTYGNFIKCFQNIVADEC